MSAHFPRYQLCEIEDFPWCPVFLREYAHKLLHQFWCTPSNTGSDSPGRRIASQAADLLITFLPENPSQYTFVDCCAGAGGPTPLLEEDLNSRIASEKQQEKEDDGGGSSKNTKIKPIEFILSDQYPDIEAWKTIVKNCEDRDDVGPGNSNIRYIETPTDATTITRYVTDATQKEVRMFNLCFHHFTEETARRALRCAVEGADAFVYVSVLPLSLQVFCDGKITDRHHCKHL